jgi:hypothetical protein
VLAQKEPALEPLPPASLLPQERVLLLAWLLLAWLLLAWLLLAWLLLAWLLLAWLLLTWLLLTWLLLAWLLLAWLRQLSSRLVLPSSLPAWLLPF